MFCENCGIQLTSDANFCPQCGKSLSKTIPPQPAANAIPNPSARSADAEDVEAGARTSPQTSGESAIEPHAPVDLRAMELAKPTPPPLSKTRASSLHGAKSNATNSECAAIATVLAAILFLIFLSVSIELRLAIVAFYVALAFGIWNMSRTAAMICLIFACFDLLSIITIAITDPSLQGTSLTGPSLSERTSAAASRVAPKIVLYSLWIKFLYGAVKESFSYHRDRSTI